MKTTFRTRLIFLILTAILATQMACIGSQAVAPLDGQTLAIQAKTAMQGMKWAIEGTHGAVVLMNPVDKILFVWPIKDGWAFIGFNVDGKTVMSTMNDIASGGNFVNAKTMSDFVKLLAAYGWEKTEPALVPQNIKTAVVTLESWLYSTSTTLPTFVFMPYGGVNISEEVIEDVLNVDLEGYQ